MKKYKWEKEVKLHIVWDGPDKKKLEKLSETLGISKNVIFHWLLPVSKVREEFLPSLHIFVNPSLQEWLPTTVIEALISWASVVATDVGWTREILRYAQFILVAPRSIRALSNWLEQSVTSLSSKTSSKIPVSLFSWEQTFREFSEVYNLIK
jgi:glycosyltransferase involved in cell wall biosynthesis